MAATTALVLRLCHEAVILGLESVKCLAEGLFFAVGFFEEFFEVADALVFALAVCTLGSAVLSSPPGYDRWRSVLIAVLPPPLWLCGGMLGIVG